MCAAPLSNEPRDASTPPPIKFRKEQIADNFKTSGQSASKADGVSPAIQKSTEDAVIPAKHKFLDKAGEFADKAKNKAKELFGRDRDYTITENDSYIKEMLKLQDEVQNFGENNTIKTAMDRAGDKNGPSLEEVKDKHDFNLLGKAQSAFYTTATVVAKLYQATQEKLSDLKDIFDGIGNASQVPYNFKAELPDSIEDESILKKEPETQRVEEIEPDHEYLKAKAENQELARAAARDALKEKELNLGDRENKIQGYKNDIDELIKMQQSFNNSSQEEAFGAATAEINQKLEDFINEDEGFMQRYLKGENIDLALRKEAFASLINDYNEQVKKYS